ncbi:MAG: Xaa-Pro peptidase family protein [Spirochaetaceae bacterium]|jgi:Xaa-Pro aminopeptidase|nr:Xaa-Pro peptidase family protein [Spirochaetaceae bacterium]
MSTDVYQKRWRRARELMDAAGVSALFLVPTTDLYYMTGFRGHIGDRLTAFVLLPERRDVSPAFFLYPAFEKAAINRELLESAECVPYRDGEDPYRALTALFPEPDGLIAVDTRLWSGVLLSLESAMPRARWLDAEKIIAPMRLQKDAAERALLEEAQSRAGRALMELFAWGLTGRTERETAEKLTGFCAGAGLERADWGPVVASGENSAIPHHESGDKVIGKGEPVVIDFGGVYAGYQADITRTPVTGAASGEFRAVYETVLAANEAAFRAARVGASSASVDAAARDVIARAGYGDYFTHRLGHGIGLDIHEAPYMVGGSALSLAPGMAFSDEPGIYLPGKFGVRIEDILFMGGETAERLTAFPRELREL